MQTDDGFKHLFATNCKSRGVSITPLLSDLLVCSVARGVPVALMEEIAEDVRSRAFLRQHAAYMHLAVKDHHNAHIVETANTW